MTGSEQAHSPEIMVSGVCERDLDLLLLEELATNVGFRAWFIRRVAPTLDASGRLLAAKRGVTESNGESDLEIAWQLPDGSSAHLLIENKIDANLQANQAARYRERAQTYLRRGACSWARTVIVAPLRYFGEGESTRGFDARVTYEQISDRLREAGQLGARGAYKLYLLSEAIQKSARGYQPVADAPVTDFWRSYWRLASQVAPELEMKEPIAKPARAGFISFRPPALPRGVEICHKLPHGNVDLQFGGWGSRVREFGRSVEFALDPDMTVVAANKSASVRLRVPVVSTLQDFAAQQGAVERGLGAARRLLEWFRRHEDLLAALAMRRDRAAAD